MRSDETHLRDILAAAAKIVRYRQTLEADADDLSRGGLEDAVLHQLTVVGEAVGRLSGALWASIPEVNWIRIKGLRNLITHEYHRVDMTIIWQVVDEHLRVLVFHCERLLAQLEQDSSAPETRTCSGSDGTGVREQ